MRRFQFVHTAGLRLDAPFLGVGRVTTRVRDFLGEATAGAWDDLVELCIKKRVAFIVIAGGLESGDSDGLGGRLRLRRGLKRLAEHGVRCFLTLDDGDRGLNAALADLRSSEVTVFPADRPLTVKIERDGKVIAAVCGQSAPAEGEIDYGAFFATAPAGVPLVGVVPGSVEDLEGSLDRGGRKVSYWALGNTLEPSRRGFSPWIVECGCLQSHSNAPRERGARGAMLIEVDGERVLAVDHVAVDRVRYAELSVPPRFDFDDALLVHQIMDGLNRLRSTNSGRALLVDISLESTAGQLDGQSLAHERTSRLLEQLREQTQSWDPFVWCSGVRMAAAPQSPELIADQLGQAIVQESRALLSNTLQRSYSFARRFEPLMRRWTSELDTGDAERLIADATTLALRHAHDTVPAEE